MDKTNILIGIFHLCFKDSHKTIIKSGYPEPFYKAANRVEEFHEIRIREDFHQSLLHECAHWFIAGEARRQQDDYGYWYIPDGRNIQDQKLFYTLESKVQAVEKLLSELVNIHFIASADNLSELSEADYQAFTNNIEWEYQKLKSKDFSPRLKKFTQALLNAQKTHQI